MKTLFLRIFLGFWLATAIVVAVLVVSSPLLTRSRPRLERWEKISESLLREVTHQAREMLDHRGLESVRRMEAHVRGERPYRLYLFDPAGELVVGIDPPPEVRRIAQRAVTSDGDEVERSGSVYLLARPTHDHDRQPFVIVASTDSPPETIDLLDPTAVLPRLLLLLTVAGLLCFWLARNLTAPVAVLRRATEKLKGGDLTARVEKAVAKRRDEIGDLAREFDEMARRIETLVGAQRLLLRDVSHELRSPLARLRVALELARRRGSPEAQSAFDRIEKEAERLDALIEQLLTLSRLEAGAQAIENHPIDLAALLSEVVTDVEFEARPKECTIRLERESGLMVSGSTTLLRSALENVLRNAARYTAPGSEVTVTAAASPESGQRHGLVRVRDHGPGVPEALLTRIFEPFFRVEDSRDRGSGGTGLGLAIAARIVRSHRGSIAAYNALDGGLIVEISFPVQ